MGIECANGKRALPLRGRFGPAKLVRRLKKGAAPVLISGLLPVTAALGQDGDKAASVAIPSAPNAARQWIQRNTHLNPDDVVFLGDGYLLALTPEPGGSFVLHEEVSGSAGAERLGGRSAEAYVVVDCSRRLTKIQSASVFEIAGAGGQARSIAPQALLASSPEAIFDLTKAACDVHFRRPLSSRTLDAHGGMQTGEAAPAGGPSGAKPGERWIQAGAFGSRAMAEGAKSRITAALTLARVTAPVQVIDGAAQSDALVRVVIGPLRAKEDGRLICLRLQRLGLGCLPLRSL